MLECEDTMKHSNFLFYLDGSVTRARAEVVQSGTYL